MTYYAVMNTQTQTNLVEAFDILLAAHKSHSRAALAVGLTPGHYRKIRHNRANIPNRLAELIILKAEQAAKESANA